LDFGSCRYYPSCSQYAKITIRYNNIFIAIYNSAKRILTCNQYFDGGIDYPKVKSIVLYKKNKYILKQSFVRFDITRVQSWLMYTDKNKKELYWIANFNTKKTQ
jgi:putative membrane protein insertion efficiency factor